MHITNDVVSAFQGAKSSVRAVPTGATFFGHLVSDKLSSSGAFTVFLQCGQQLGQDCALQSERSAKQVPVQALLTLPDNIVDQHTGSKVTQKKLRVGKDITQNVFHTMQFGQDRKGSIDFVVAQKDVENMLKTRPDNYTGTVTVIFDPMIY